MVNKGAHILLFTFLFIVVSHLTWAQSFTASVNSNEVSPDQQINVTFTIEGNFQRITDLNFPEFNGFRVLSQPQQYQSTSNINGVVSKNYQFTIAIKPISKGKFTIQPASVKLDGKLYKTKSIDIQVVSADNISKKPKSGDTKTVISDKDVFARTLISKSKIFMGEAFSLTQKVYSRKEIMDISDIKFPQYEGFLVEDIDIGQLRVETEVINGIQFYVIVLQKKILFARKSGKITLKPLKLKLDIKEIKTRNARNQAEQMWYGPTIRYAEKVTQSVTAPSVSVQVESLPPEPAGFEDLIGDFNLSVSTDKETTKINDPITLTIKVEGTGNHHLLSDFNLDLPDDIETYEPKIKQNLSLTGNGFKGYKSFEYLLVPRKAGHFNLPPVTIIYFDVKKAIYRTLSSDQIQIKVEKGEGNYTGDLPTGLSKKEIELRGKDIQFIKQELGEFTYKNKPFIGSFIFYLYYLIPALLFLLFIIFYKRFTKFRNNVALFRQRKASSYSHKKLKKAKKMLSANNTVSFYEEVLNAINGYLGDKLVLSSAELSREKVSEVLLEKQLNQELIKDLFELIDACEFARFSPSSIPGNMNSTYQQAYTLLIKLEKAISK
ncbi:MAG: protein BatD [Bacteroidetes bacterium]|nr:protein BatD [Bacteroidota bacterium]